MDCYGKGQGKTYHFGQSIINGLGLNVWTKIGIYLSLCNLELVIG